jgi:sigma-B regulation protein RsbU (phosphoserine phosphatase)
MVRKQQTLRRVPLFASLPQSEIEYLAANLRPLHVAEGVTLIQEGTPSDRCYILVEGVVEIIKSAGTDEARLIARREAGILLGEMSLFSQQGQHTASVRAATPLELLVMTDADLDALLHRQPRLAYDLVGMIARRLEQSENNTILELREKNRQLTQAYQELKAAQARLVEQERLERELEIARQIQSSTLPRRLPRLAGYDFGALISPARAVGGDFYDFIPLGGSRMGVAVGDVSDKGVPAALYMSLVYSLVRAEARRHRTPGGVLGAVNNLLLDMEVTHMYVTLVYAVLDYQKQELSYARAGHPYPLLITADGGQVAPAGGIGQPLGLLPDPRLDEQVVAVPPGGTILLFTDGITEAADQGGSSFGDQRLLGALQRHAALPAQEICDSLYRLVDRHCGLTPQQDDITLLCLRHLGY